MRKLKNETQDLLKMRGEVNTLKNENVELKRLSGKGGEEL